MMVKLLTTKAERLEAMIEEQIGEEDLKKYFVNEMKNIKKQSHSITKIMKNSTWALKLQ